MENKVMNILKTGAQFKATDKMNRTYSYEFVGFDLDDRLSGTGCAYIVLKNLTTNTLTCVEVEWFNERKIEEVNSHRTVIEVPCKAGILCAENGGDPDYPEIFTYLRREGGEEIDICGVEGEAVIPEGMVVDEQKRCEGGLKAFLYSDTSKEDWTHSHVFSEAALNIQVD